MTLYEIFDGDTYLFTVSPSENPRNVLDSERMKRRNYRLRLIAVRNGKRTEFEGPSEPAPIEDEELDFGFADEGYEDEAASY